MKRSANFRSSGRSRYSEHWLEGGLVEDSAQFAAEERLRADVDA